jgi:hypothetical protein
MAVAGRWALAKVTPLNPDGSRITEYEDREEMMCDREIIDRGIPLLSEPCSTSCLSVLENHLDTYAHPEIHGWRDKPMEES